MNKSETIKELSSALSKFQGEVTDVTKTKEVKINGRVMFKHAELSGVLDIARPLLNKYELSVVQLPGAADNKITIETCLLHSSGEWISSTIEMSIDTGSQRMSGPQEVGKYITYGRRYALAAMLGIAQADDEESMVQIKEKNTTSYEKATKDQLKYLRELLASDAPRLESVLKWAGVSCLENLPATAATKAINHLIAEKTTQEANKNTSLVSEEQIKHLEKLLNPERLFELMDQYSLTNIKEMKVADYYKEYDRLRMELSTEEQQKQQLN